MQIKFIILKEKEIVIKSLPKNEAIEMLNETSSLWLWQSIIITDALSNRRSQ
jgi:hypothetical protein